MKIIKVDTIRHANNFFKRLKGYMFQKRPMNSEIMIFDNCNSVHTFNMKFKIDILFLDAQNRVVKKSSSVPHGRFLSPVKEASRVVEAPDGLFDQIEENDVVAFDALLFPKRS
jgi:hypothetical protein